VVRDLGGLHHFMGWSGAILTDSGGFQVFSLAKSASSATTAWSFRAPLDGATRFLSPESVVENPAKRSARTSRCRSTSAWPTRPRARPPSARSPLTLRWAARARAAHAAAAGGQALFGIVQGGTYDDLRAEAVERTVALGFDGYAIGGMAVGEPKPTMLELTARVAAALPADRAPLSHGRRQAGGPGGVGRARRRHVRLRAPTRNAR